MVKSKETIEAFTRLMKLNDSRADLKDLELLARLIVEAVNSWMDMNAAKAEFYRGPKDA